MNLKVLTAIAFGLAVSGCVRNVKTDTPVLSIGKFTLTAQDLESKKNDPGNKSLSEQALHDKLIEEGRILAFALDHRYDTIAALSKLLEYAVRSNATSERGFVWKKKVIPQLQFSEKDLADAYAKRSQQLLLEIIRIHDKKVLDRYFTSKSDFDALKKRISSDTAATVFTTPLRFPYSPLSVYVNDVDKAKPGDVLGPVMSDDGYLVARIIAIQPIRQNPYEQEKEGIKQELISTFTRKYIWESETQVHHQAKPEINEAAVREIASKYNATQKSWPGVAPTLPLMTYTLGGKRVTYCLSDFDEFVKNEPVFFGSLSNPEDVKKMFKYFITEQYVFAEGQQMNMEQDEAYQQFRKNYQQKVFVEYFKRQYVYPKVSVAPEEPETYYREHSGDFMAIESATVGVYTFNDFRSAIRKRMYIARDLQVASRPEVKNTSTGTSPSSGAVVTEFNLKNQEYNPRLVAVLLTLSPGQISSPMEINGKYLILSLFSKKGNAPLPFIYVKEQIQQRLIAQKGRQLTAQLTEDFKAKYPTEKDNITEYLSQASDKQP